MGKLGSMPLDLTKSEKPSRPWGPSRAHIYDYLFFLKK